jgi:hypothetical protein
MKRRKRVTYTVVREGEHLLKSQSLAEATAEAERREAWEQNEAPKWGCKPARIWIEETH